MRSLSAHTLTFVLTLVVVLAILGLRQPSGPGIGVGVPVREPSWPRPSGSEAYTSRVAPPSIPDDVLARVDADEQINIRVYEAVNRGVVNITTSAEGGLFGDEVASGSGSGFVIDPQGHVLTNYHVISGAEAVQVTLFDGSTHPAELVGADPSNDVAIVRVGVEAKQLVPVALGDSSKLLVGQKVLALGNPFGLERTLTVGIISALDRSMQAKNGRTIKGIIQTDAAINPGNSGGPLLNSRGEVIGMNTAIISQVGQSAGIGFAVPINAIKRILNPLIEHGRVVRADLGIRRAFATEYGLFIVDMVEDGPVDRAGLQPLGIRLERFGPFAQRRLDPDSADRIVAIDGKAVRTVDELLTEVEAHAPGETVTLTVVRQGRKRGVKVTLGQSG